MTRHPTAEKAYALAREAFAAIGVDTEAALARLDRVPISLHCCRRRRARVREPAGPLTGGIQATGNYRVRRNADELRADVEVAMARSRAKALQPARDLLGNQPPRRAQRDQPEHFQRWVDWAKQRGSGWTSTPLLLAPEERAEHDAQPP